MDASSPAAHVPGTVTAQSREVTAVPDLPPLSAALVGLDTAIERTEILATHLEERLQQVLREAMPVAMERLQNPRFGVPYADSLVSREERLSMANERVALLLDRLGV